MNEPSVNAILPFVREIGIPVGIVAGSFVLRKIAAILEKMFKALEEFLSTFSKVSVAFLLAYFVALTIKYFA